MSETSAQPYLLKFWYRPGTVIRALLEAKQGQNLALACFLLFGAMQALPFYLSEDGVSPLILIFGAAVGLFGLYLFSWLLRNFGRWFGVQARLYEMRVALGWGLMPWTVLFAVLASMVRMQGAEATASLAPILFVGFVYGYAVILLSIAAALRLSVLKAFLCLIVTCAVSTFPIILLAQFVAQAFNVAPVGS
ncbi:MAG: YIP1 family protein [Lentimonas sp.]